MGTKLGTPCAAAVGPRVAHTATGCACALLQVRFIVATLSSCEPQVSWMVLDALEGKRRLHEIDAATHRCAKFLFASVDSDNSDVVTAAICMNVENELSLTLSPAEVAAWLGKVAEAHE